MRCMGTRYENLLKHSSVQLNNYWQLNHYYSNSGSQQTTLTWPQFLITTLPSALITGHGEYLYLSGIRSSLSGDTISVVQAKRVTSLTVFMPYYQQIQDVSGLVNVLVFCYIIYRKFITRGWYSYV